MGAYLDLQNPAKPSSSKEHYVCKLRRDINVAFKVATREAQKSADGNKETYDLKVRNIGYLEMYVHGVSKS